MIVGDKQMIIENGVLVKVNEEDIVDGKVYIPTGVTKIGVEAFVGIVNVEELVIPDSVTEIAESAFMFCVSLKKVNLPPNLQKIGAVAFASCESLEEIEIPNSVKDLGEVLFSGCKLLKRVTLPQGLEILPQNFFEGCESLEEIVLPDTLKEIQKNVFQNCSNLKRINLPEGLEKILSNAFENCESLEEIVIPSSIKVIDYCTFQNCKKLKLVELQEGLEIINAAAFSDCESLEEMFIPDSVEIIEDCTFQKCKALKKIKLPQNLTQISEALFYECESLEEVLIPNNVTCLKVSAFEACKKLKKIELPNGLEEILEQVFCNCESLEEVILPNSVKKLGEHAFNGCKSLKRIILSEGLITIPKCAFRNCENLEEVVIPNEIETIGSYAFSGCQSLKKVILPNNLNWIFSNTFENCESLEEIVIPSSVKEIGKGAFKNNKSLRKLILQSGLEKIESGAFEGCASLEEIIFPASVKEIAADAFPDDMKKVTYEQLELELDKFNISEQLREKIRTQLNPKVIGKYDEEYVRKVLKWSEKGFIPPYEIFSKIDIDKIDSFKKDIWFKLVKKAGVANTPESKGALVEIAYSMGLFDTDVVEQRGEPRLVSDLTPQDRRNGNFDDAQKRMTKMIDLIKSGKLTSENIHKMFDGTNMTFDPTFYRFFVDNVDEIVGNLEIMDKIPNIQREMQKIKSTCRGYMPTVNESLRYLENITYENVKVGNEELAKLCQMCDVPQASFDEYQNIFREQRRRKESTIPNVQGKNYRFLRLNDPKALVIGEGKFSKCCQRLHGAGESCMRHSATSKNGRIFEVLDDDGTLIAQSWVWRNGNVVCFDSIEANQIDDNKKYSNADKERLVQKIREAYQQAAQELIDSSETSVAAYKQKKTREIMALDIPEDEKKKRLEVLEQICETSKIKAVTVGQGYWPISQKIVEGFQNTFRLPEGGRAKPLEDVGYLQDSNVQFLLASSDDREAIITGREEVSVLYRDKRELIREEGDAISDMTVGRLRIIEYQAHKTGMRVAKKAKTVDDLAQIYGTRVDNLRVIRGEDWYYVYSHERDEIHIHDLAHGSPRLRDENVQGRNRIG